MTLFSVHHHAAELARSRAESDYAAARRQARKMGFHALPERVTMSVAGAQKFRFKGRGGRQIDLVVVEHT